MLSNTSNTKYNAQYNTNNRHNVKKYNIISIRGQVKRSILGPQGRSLAKSFGSLSINDNYISLNGDVKALI